MEPGTYVTFKFETKAPDGTLLAAIQDEVADWPGDASVLVVATFTAAGGDPVSVRVFFSGEVKIEMAFSEPLVVAEDDPLKEMIVVVSPELWFMNDDGTVTDLRDLDFAATHAVARLEAKFAEGFTKIEVEP